MADVSYHWRKIAPDWLRVGGHKPFDVRSPGNRSMFWARDHGQSERDSTFKVAGIRSEVTNGA